MFVQGSDYTESCGVNPQKFSCQFKYFAITTATIFNQTPHYRVSTNDYR